MTSKLTREKAQWLHDACEEAAAAGIKLTMNPNELLMFTSYALAAMDSEPVIADCDPEVYEKGASACLVVIPKETAEVICKGISAATGCKVDWHYIGGRVHIKALRAAMLQGKADGSLTNEGTIQAQPQNAPQNITEIIPGWIPVSERVPDCWCRTCRPVVLNDMRFVVCPDCGNKRCPRANDHRNACTGSNEPSQEGSAYPDIPREVK